MSKQGRSFWNKFKGKPKRSREELQGRYGELCAKAGELQYRIRMQQAELDGLNQAMQELNNEAYAVMLKGGKSQPGPGDASSIVQEAPQSIADTQGRGE